MCVVCQSESGKWCSNTKGCCTAKGWSITFGILFIVWLLVAIFVPKLIDSIIDEELCFNLCIPTPNSPDWVYENWRTTDNDTINPPVYIEFQLYNVTNVDDIKLYGNTPIVEVLGPYTYKYREEKFNISYSDDWKEVSYSISTEFTFVPERSNGSETDLIWNINIPFMGGVELFYVTQGKHMTAEQYLPCRNEKNQQGPDQACLFGERNVTEMIFSQYSADIALSTGTYFPDRPLNKDFQLFTRCYNPNDCYIKQTDMANYGLGGKCNLVYPNNRSATFLNYTFCEDPVSTPETDIRWTVRTGQSGTMGDMWKIKKWLGNESIWYWNTTFDENGLPTRPEMCDGTSVQLQFPINVGSGDILTVWDDSAMRSVDMVYVDSFDNEYGIPVYRFRTTDELYSGTDTYYNNNGKVGFLNVSALGLVTKGGFTPLLASRMYQAGADPALRALVNCTNCPDIPDGLPNDVLDIEYGSFFDINPELGKTLHGEKKLQVNIEIGQPELFANTVYGSIPRAILPYLTYNMSEGMNETQKDIIQDGLDGLHMGQTARKAILIVSIILTFICGFAAVGLFFRWRTVIRDYIDPDTPQHTSDGYERARGPDGDPHYPGVSYSAGLEGSKGRNVQEGDSYRRLGS